MPSRLRSLLAAVVAGCALTATAALRDAGPDVPPAEVVPALRQAEPRYLKGNLHTHSLWSDGDDFPEMIADWYKRHGYEFLALTEHNVVADGDRWADVPAGKATKEAVAKYVARFGSAWVEQRQKGDKTQVRLKPLAEFRSVLDEPGRFLLVPGEEISDSYNKAPIHLNAINPRDVLPPMHGESRPDTVRANLRAVAAQAAKAKRRMLVFVNHPNYTWGLKAEDLAPVDELRYFEVFNGHPGVKNYGDGTHASVERVWDIVLALRLGKFGLGPVYGLATDDAHAYHSYGVGKTNPGRGWVMVKAPYLTAEAVVRGIEDGHFYASTGVTLRDVSRVGDEVVVAIKGEAGVRYKTEFVATLKGTPLEGTPKRDKDGKVLDVTAEYSPEIGKIVDTVDGTEAKYRLSGKELYVRAKVTSSKPHPNPYAKGDLECAWTQPVRP